MPISFFTILAAAIAGWLAGALWYGVLGRRWRNALGWTDADLLDPLGRKRMPLGPMVLSFFALLLMGYLLSGIIFHIGTPTPYRGMVSGALVWLGFTLPPLVVNNAFQRRKLMLTVIDSGHWLVVLLLQGAIIGALA